MIDVNTPIICIQDYDQVSVDALLEELFIDLIGNDMNNIDKITEWSPGLGCCCFGSKNVPIKEPGDKKRLLISFLEEIYTAPGAKLKPIERFIVLKSVNDYLADPEVKFLLSQISLRKLYGVKADGSDDFDTTIIITGPSIDMPSDLEPFVSYLELGFPSDDEIKRLIKEHVEVNGFGNFKEEDANKLLPSLKGLTKYEVDRMLDMAMSSNGTLQAEDTAMILRHKKQMVKKSGLLELVDAPQKMDSIGGLEVLKEYLNTKAMIMKNLGKAIEMHVAIPKGVFLVGLPGCGKSLCAKATASLFDAPLLKLDMGNMMGRYLGEAEKRLRKSIQLAEAAAPCVLWIDEIEKAFSGIGGENDTLTRMFGYFLTWLQDKSSAVYVVATANNAANLPPEFKRKGRFDELFKLELPNDEERRSIFEVHLKRCNQDIKISDELIAATKGFNGADIESVVNQAMEHRFLKHLNNEDEKITTELLCKIASNTNSISNTCKEDIKKMREILDTCQFINASKSR